MGKKVVIEITMNSSQTIQIENEAPSSSDIDAFGQTTGHVTHPRVTNDQFSYNSSTYSDTYDPYDGTTDYAGPSGRTWSNVTSNGSKTYTYTDPSDLAYFEGMGTFDVTLSTSTHLWVTISGGGTTSSELSTVANAEICVTYTHADPPLAVVLTSFTALYNGDATCLSWTTQTETSNLGWDIFRSETSNFEEAIKVNVHLIPGAGTTSEPTNYEYVDYYPIETGKTYFYWVVGKDASGITDNFGPIAVDIPFNNNQNPDPPEIHSQEYYLNNYPNPFYSNTTIAFLVKEAGSAELSIYNIKGQKIVTLFKAPISYHNINKLVSCHWNGKDKNGNNVSEGVYLSVLKINGKIFSKNMVLLK